MQHDFEREYATFAEFKEKYAELGAFQKRAMQKFSIFRREQ